MFWREAAEPVRDLEVTRNHNCKAFSLENCALVGDRVSADIIRQLKQRKADFS